MCERGSPGAASSTNMKPHQSIEPLWPCLVQVGRCLGSVGRLLPPRVGEHRQALPALTPVTAAKRDTISMLAIGTKQLISGTPNLLGSFNKSAVASGLSTG